jgi:TfoX/Sxy family transcriptional regulator of competence genes
MAYDEKLADRIRTVVADLDVEIREQKMFGGLAFLLNGRMFTGIVGSELMVKLGESAAAQALQRAHVRPMDFTGRPSKGMVFVAPEGLRGAALRRWVTQAADHVRDSPPRQNR